MTVSVFKRSQKTGKPTGRVVFRGVYDHESGAVISLDRICRMKVDFTRYVLLEIN